MTDFGDSDIGDSESSMSFIIVSDSVFESKELSVSGRGRLEISLLSVLLHEPWVLESFALVLLLSAASEFMCLLVVSFARMAFFHGTGKVRFTRSGQVDTISADVTVTEFGVKELYPVALSLYQVIDHIHSSLAVLLVCGWYCTYEKRGASNGPLDRV